MDKDFKIGQNADVDFALNGMNVEVVLSATFPIGAGGEFKSANTFSYPAVSYLLKLISALNAKLPPGIEPIAAGIEAELEAKLGIKSA